MHDMSEEKVKFPPGGSIKVNLPLLLLLTSYSVLADWLLLWFTASLFSLHKGNLSLQAILCKCFFEHERCLCVPWNPIRMTAAVINLIRALSWIHCPSIWICPSCHLSSLVTWQEDLLHHLVHPFFTLNTIVHCFFSSLLLLPFILLCNNKDKPHPETTLQKLFYINNQLSSSSCPFLSVSATFCLIVFNIYFAFPRGKARLRCALICRVPVTYTQSAVSPEGFCDLTGDVIKFGNNITILDYTFHMLLHRYFVCWIEIKLVKDWQTGRRLITLPALIHCVFVCLSHLRLRLSSSSAALCWVCIAFTQSVSAC